MRLSCRGESSNRKTPESATPKLSVVEHMRQSCGGESSNRKTPESATPKLSVVEQMRLSCRGESSNRKTPESAAARPLRDKLNDELTQTLVIMRGLPGCGKTYRAKELCGSNGVICSTDDYF